MNTTPNTRRLPLIVALTLAAALAACSKNDERTAGQKLDGAIAEAKQAGQEAKVDAQQAATTAEAKIEQAAAATSDVVTDATITTKINAALAADDQLKAIKIDVDTKEGRVTLTGSAPDATSLSRATTLAQAVTGVRSVDNRLVVARNG